MTIITIIDLAQARARRAATAFQPPVPLQSAVLADGPSRWEHLHQPLDRVMQRVRATGPVHDMLTAQQERDQ